MAVHCSCTLSWCKALRKENKVSCKRSFVLPRVGGKEDSTERETAEKLCKSIQAKLRPGAKRPMRDGSHNGFLWWHLHPTSFQWRSTFSRNAKRRRPDCEVSQIKVSITKQTPPPEGREASWNGHDWVSPVTGVVVASGSVFEVPKTPAEEDRVVSAALKAVSAEKLGVKRKKQAVQDVTNLYSKACEMLQREREAREREKEEHECTKAALEAAHLKLNNVHDHVSILEKKLQAAERSKKELKEKADLVKQKLRQEVQKANARILG